MKKEEIEQLAKLQKDIEEMAKAVDALLNYDFEVKIPKLDSWYHIPVEKVTDLKNGIKQWMIDQIMEYQNDLEAKLEELTLCKEVKGETNYKPTTI